MNMRTDHSVRHFGAVFSKTFIYCQHGNDMFAFTKIITGFDRHFKKYTTFLSGNEQRIYVDDVLKLKET